MPDHIEIKDYDLEKLQKSEKLFDPELIKTVLNRQTSNEIVFFSIWDAAHKAFMNDEYFFMSFPEILKLNGINLDGLSRHEAITIYKQEPKIQLGQNEDIGEDEKPKKSLLSVILGV